jgi:hypothetical protein
VPGEGVPAAGGVAAVEVERRLPVEAALGEELPRRRRLGRTELLGVEGRRGGVGRDESCPLADRRAVGPARRPATVVLVVQFDVGAAGEPLDRLAERQMVDLLDERNDIATGIAAETMPQVSRGCDVERRRLLVVERAEALQAPAAGALELQVLTDHLVDAAAVAHQRDVGSADAPSPGHLVSPQPIPGAPAMLSPVAR